ncbi:hypothetical protein CASFOL_023922 [Castilleja foliolosa]|uniref:Pentatricopeptide repeat-containing protein n=1 Tax=Castilleja foliolosa TaxID=1961234 RepID=A0ABD3CLV2_9LAMI
MYAKCAKTSSAHKMFDEMSHRDTVTWNALISGYVKALDSEWFVKIRREDIPIIACEQLANGKLGAQVHSLSQNLGLESNAVVGSSLNNLHVKCGDMADKNVISWSSMISGVSELCKICSSITDGIKSLGMPLLPDFLTWAFGKHD